MEGIGHAPSTLQGDHADKCTAGEVVTVVGSFDITNLIRESGSGRSGECTGGFWRVLCDASRIILPLAVLELRRRGLRETLLLDTYVIDLLDRVFFLKSSPLALRCLIVPVCADCYKRGGIPRYFFYIFFLDKKARSHNT